MPFKFSSHGQTDVGLVREKNEDVWGEILEDNFFVLADGMGGHRAGEIASREAVTTMCRLVRRTISQKSDLSIESIKKALSHAIHDVNIAIFTMGNTSEELRGMGTTLCCVYFYRDSIIYAHVGDSRIYRVRNESIEQLTRDHSLYADLIDSGKMKAENSDTFMYKNIITKAIGTDPEVEPEIESNIVHDQDYYLLCSDGLTDLLSDDEIKRMVLESGSVKDCAERLINRALEEGGQDNITVIVLHAEKQDNL